MDKARRDRELHYERAKRRFRAIRGQLRGMIRIAEGKIDGARKARFSDIADRVNGDRWVTVSPTGWPRHITTMDDGFTAEAKFNPIDWPSDIQPNEIHRGLTACREAYRWLLSVYETLPAPERAQFSPDGKPKP